MFHLISINCRYSHSCLALFYVRNALEQQLPEQPLIFSQFTINDPYYATLLRISGESTKALFFSVYIWNHRFIRRLINDLAQLRPNLAIILGGPQAQALGELPAQCTLFLGEIEGAPKEFYQNLEKGCLQSLYRAEKAHSFPSPYRQEDFTGALKNRQFYYESSRGCPFSCSYCCNSFLSKLYETKRIRRRSPHNVIAELRSEVGKFPELILINIHDDCFLAHSREWHQEFVKDYKKWINRPFIVRSTPLHLTEEKIKILKEAGLAWVTMGLQSGSERINREVYCRNVPNEKFIDATRLAKQYGVSGYYDVILDNPFEEERDVVETLTVLGKIPKPFQLQLFTLTFYQGTDLYRMMQEKMGEKGTRNIKNYFSYRPTFVNKLVRISPLISSALLHALIDHRKTIAARILLAPLHCVIVILVEPLSYFYLMLKGFNYNLLLTLKIALPTFKTKIRERLMNF